MEEADIILAHPPSFDGLASAVAVRRLRPGSIIVLAAELRGPVAEFAGLHGEVCGFQPGHTDLSGVRHVWHAAGSSPPRPADLPAAARWGTQAGTGEGGALATGLVLALARSARPVSPMEATLFYIGILEGVGGLPGPADVRALLFALEQGASPEVAREFLRAPGGAHVPATWPDPSRATAADVMTTPVQAVAPATAIAEAHALLLRTGHGALPVTADDRPVGLATRSDLERAVRHGLGDRPVLEAMSPDPPAVPPQAPAADVVHLLALPGPGRVLVVEAGILLGIISRSDVLARLYDRLPGPAAAPAGERRRRPRAETVEAASLLEARWAPGHVALLRRVSRAAAEGRRVYLVGGTVRDLLLDRPSYDVDLMVEEDGERFARALARDLGAAVSVHVPFGTATLTLPDGGRIDVATSRAELYARPGALPDVAPAGLVQDLERRDFTVNALAMRVDPEAWGRVVDPFGGLADLRARRLRILHNLSFVEDPTRLVRAVRFERTLDMRLCTVTEGFARYAMATGRLDGLGGERLKAELRKLLALPGLAASASRLAELDGWRLVHAPLAGQPVAAAPLDRLDGMIDGWPDLRPDDRAAARYRGTLALVLEPAGTDGARRAMAGLHSAAEDAHAVQGAIEAAASLLPVAASWAEGPPSLRFEALRGLDGCALRHLAARSGSSAVGSAIAEHLAQRHVRLEAVDGHWLQEQGIPPGPLLGRILAETLAALIDGEIAGPEAERTFALGRAHALGAGRVDR